MPNTETVELLIQGGAVAIALVLVYVLYKVVGANTAIMAELKGIITSFQHNIDKINNIPTRDDLNAHEQRMTGLHNETHTKLNKLTKPRKK